MADRTQEQLIDELLKDYKGPESFWGESGIFAQLKKKIIERTLDAEMDNHLGYTKHNPRGHNSGNSRNGRGKKTIVVDSEPVNLDAFGKKWDTKYPTISQMWRNHWEHVIPFFDYPQDIRKVIYTTNAIESLNRSLRKVIKTKGAFPSDASIMKIFYMALANRL